MNVKAQKIFVLIFYLISIASFVYGLLFMTDYYHIYGFGTSEMMPFYNMLQIFNKNYFSESLISVVFCIFLIVTRVGRNVVNNVVYAITLVGTLFISYTAFSNIGDLQFLKSRYLTFDFSEVMNYTPTTTWFDTGVVVSILVIVSALLLLVSVSINKFKKEGAN